MIFYDKYVIYENIICDIPQKLCKKIAGSRRSFSIGEQMLHLHAMVVPQPMKLEGATQFEGAWQRRQGGTAFRCDARLWVLVPNVICDIFFSQKFLAIRRKIVGQILPCTMMSYMCMLTYKGAMLQAPPIGFVHADSYHKVHL